MIYLFWFAHILFGSLVDSRIWGRKEEDPKWLADYFDLFWLGWFAVVPFVSVYVGSDIFTIKSALIAFGMSIVWDLTYSKIELKKWVAPLPLWFIIPNPFGERIVIGFTETGMYYFNSLRILVLIGTLFM